MGLQLESMTRPHRLGTGIIRQLSHKNILELLTSMYSCVVVLVFTLMMFMEGTQVSSNQNTISHTVLYM